MNPPKLYLKSHVYINYTRDVEGGAPLNKPLLRLDNTI